MDSDSTVFQGGPADGLHVQISDDETETIYIESIAPPLVHLYVRDGDALRFERQLDAEEAAATVGGVPVEADADGDARV
ncbi:hypothetical protein SK069_09885 [Patulibacter brassicae]|jgi:hypothetical protein|uniref:Response regulator n=1 Tax=Patulibacter brassicae TaxID=1705717 RepID=A0ABU4VJ88_9ACTN|nr:hypothetical protein [Patulibacter brassicae]MDX8151901.1 hypothetical protein [Patulibacter brassicae]